MELDLLWSSEFIMFAILSVVALVSAWQMVTTRLITHAALFMALSFTAVAGVFLQMGAEFVAAIQVLIYAGAITTMVIFAIMLSGIGDIKGDRSAKKRLWMKSDPMVMVVGVIFAATMLFIYYGADLPAAREPQAVATVQSIGLSLFTTYVVPFELASILLLIAMVGAIILTAKEAE